MASTSLLQFCLRSMKFKSSVFLVQPFVTEEPVAKNFSINNMVMEERMRQGQPPPWHEEDEIDSTRVSTSIVDAVV